MKKKTEPKEYKNMPLPTDLYDQVKLISETNGYGERGMGAQVAHWVGQELRSHDVCVITPHDLFLGS